MSDIFQDDDNETLHVKIDWWQPSSRKYKGKVSKQYWVPNLDDTELRSIPINCYREKFLWLGVPQ